jgi:hypothetical protein
MSRTIASREISRLVGIGHYSANHREIALTARRAFHARDPWLVAAAIHNVGHLARRFGIIDWPLVRAAEAAANRRPEAQMVQYARNDMRGDIANYMPFRKRLAQISWEREFYGDE